jgi:hypothetical protein
VEEEEARLALLQTELNSLQASLRNYDSILLQVKGWCVTTALAAAGFAVAYHKPALILVGLAAVLGFFAINCQFRVFQRSVNKRNHRIDMELKTVGIMQVLKGAGSFDIVGTVSAGELVPSDAALRERIRKGFPGFWFEVTKPSNFSLYLFVGFCLLIELIILLL